MEEAEQLNKMNACFMDIVLKYQYIVFMLMPSISYFYSFLTDVLYFVDFRGTMWLFMLYLHNL